MQSSALFYVCTTLITETATVCSVWVFFCFWKNAWHDCVSAWGRRYWRLHIWEKGMKTTNQSFLFFNRWLCELTSGSSRRSLLTARLLSNFGWEKSISLILFMLKTVQLVYERSLYTVKYKRTLSANNWFQFQGLKVTDVYPLLTAHSTLKRIAAVCEHPSPILYWIVEMIAMAHIKSCYLPNSMGAVSSNNCALWLHTNPGMVSSICSALIKFTSAMIMHVYEAANLHNLMSHMRPLWK